MTGRKQADQIDAPQWPVPPGTSGCIILGAGGHARVVLDALLAQSRWSRFVFLDRDPALRGRMISGAPVAGDDDDLVHAGRNGFTHFIVGIGGIGDNAPRLALFEKGLAAGLEPATALHPAARLAASSVIGDGTAVLAGVVVNPDATIGRNVVLNTGCIVEHDCRIGDHAQVSPGAIVLGGVSVGRLAYIGAGAVLIQGVRIGEGAVIGAGAVVLADVPDGARAVGVPAMCTPRRR
ncbi:MAG: acetyltransferase [Rhodospirillales bacterium]|nr:acetyltransferase [Rhodospirillales bacterium]